MDITIIILAHTESQPFNSARSRYLAPLMGRPVIHYPWQLAEELNGARPWLLVSPATEPQLRPWAAERADCARREEFNAMEGMEALILLLYGDAPLLQPTQLRAFLAHAEAKSAVNLSLSGNQGPSAHLLTADRFQALLTSKKSLAEGLEAQPIKRVALEEAGAGIRIKNRVQLSRAERTMRQRINEKWMLAGVTLIDPATTYIEPSVTIGPDTIIQPHTHLRGATTIGAESELGPNSIITACTIGNRCRVTASVLEYAIMEDESDIGPFGHLRKGARLCRGAHMGNFGEMKKSTLGPGAKMGHVSYLGDTTVAAGANIGAGTITCNYDGERKHPTEIGAEAFIGSGSMLVAPVKIGAGATTGAGSVVTRDLPPGSLAYGVPARLHSEAKEPESED